MNLPNLSRKLPYNSLINILQALQPNSGSADGSAVEVSGSADDASVNKFLMSVIMSDFSWLTDLSESQGSVLSAEDQRENLANEASKRLAERCGRSAAGEMTRTWVIPMSLGIPETKIELREPPLTGDWLGLKTWGTSYVISKKLEHIGTEYLAHLLGKSSPGAHQVLELGAGTGLVGIAAAAMWKTNVLLTDLEEIQGNLLFNIDRNMPMVTDRGGRISGETLDWTEPEEALQSYASKEFEIVIAADPMYDEEHPQLVARMIDLFLNKGPESRALVAIPLRDAHTKSLAASFSSFMVEHGLSVYGQGLEVFKDDDWKTVEEVNVQWTVWSRMSVGHGVGDSL